MNSTPSPAPAAVAKTPPRPLTLRQERFCEAYVLVPNAARAARVAGYKPANAKSQGWRLLRTRRVRARLAEIQGQLARDFGGDLDALIGKLEVVYRQALEDHSAYAAARAVELQARLMGLRARQAAAPQAASVAAADDNRRHTEDELDAMIARAEAEVRRVMGEPDPEPDDDEDARPAPESATVGKGRHPVDIRSAKGRQDGQHPGRHPVDIGSTRGAPAPLFPGDTPEPPGLDFAARSGPLAKQ